MSRLRILLSRQQVFANASGSSWREEDSEDYNQTTVDFWVFQDGQGKHGDVEAFVEIYNVPNSRDRFVIEITRNCWFELTAYYNSEPFVVFPAVTGNKLSYGYMTYEVPP